MAIDIAKRRADRLRVLQAVFDAAGGATSEVVRVAPTIQLQLELSHQDLQAACDYLVGEHLIKPLATINEAPVYITVQLTHRGVVEMEQSISSPDRPTKHLPSAVSVISIMNSTIINSPIQSASPDGHQRITG
jgi:hypothetical protein